MELHDIVCPTDFSEASKRALEWARALAARTGASVEVLHVVEVLPELPPLAVFGATDEISRLREHAEKQLGALISALSESEEGPSWSDVNRTVVRGKAHREIVSVAGQHGVDLVVMGVHGHGVIDRMLFGSTTHHVVREAPCPVPSVRPPDTAEPS
jgi:nucleotide-binding universal stress UspA family protein